MDYEYAIIRKNKLMDERPTFDTLQEAREWMEVWILDDGDPDEFHIVRRSISDWVKIY